MGEIGGIDLTGIARVRGRNHCGIEKIQDPTLTTDK